MIHGIMGSFMLNGVGSSAGKLLAWIGVGILVVHTVIDWCHPDSSEFTDSEAIRKNVSETERHILGETSQWAGDTNSAVLPHRLVWKSAERNIYSVPFTTVKMVTQLLFVAAIFVHIFINIRPLLVSLGIISYKERRGDIYLILSVLLLFIAGAVIFYYIGWQYL